MRRFCKFRHCHYSRSHTTYGHLCGLCHKYGHGQIECNNDALLNILDKYKKDILPIELWCDYKNCKRKKYHNRNSHHCSRCKTRGHSSSECDTNSNKYRIKCPMCNTYNTVNLSSNKIYGLSEKCKICLDKEVNVFLPKCNHCCLCFDCLLKMKKESSHKEMDFKLYVKQESDLDEHVLERADDIIGKINDFVYCEIYVGLGCSWYIRKDKNSNDFEGFFVRDENNTLLIDFLDGYKKIE